jgi:hypothetical protein
MFLEQYKHSFKSNNIYENTSIGDNELFGLADYYTKEYLNNTYQINIKLLNDFLKTLEDIDNKFKFIDSYLENYLKLLETESINLDKEYNKINNSLSTKGQSFLNMFELNNNYNYVFDDNIIYYKNILDNGSSYIKDDYSLIQIDYRIENINNNSFFIHLGNLECIEDIFIEFYNEINFSIFGSKEDNTLELIFNNIDSKSNKLFKIQNDVKYNKFYIISNKEITNYIKNIKVYKKSDASVLNKYGYIVRKLTNLNKFTDLIFVNDSNTSLYLYDKETYSKVINDIGNDIKSEFINNNYLVKKNINVSNTFGFEELYLLEFFDINNNISLQTKIYGKEINQ